VVALGLAYAFDPVIDFFEEKGFKRQRVVFWFFLLMGFMVLLVMTLFLPYLFIQVQEFIHQLPSMIILMLTWVSEKFNLESTEIKGNLTRFIKEQYSSENFSMLAKWVTRSATGAVNWVFSLLGAAIIPVFFYFFLVDIDRFKQSTFALIPKPYQSFVKVRLGKIDQILSGFIRGQLMVALILSALYSIGLLIVGIRYGLLIGMASGLLNVVPYLGVTLGIIAGLVMAIVSGSGIWPVVGVLLVFVVVQTLEGFVITPKIVGNKVGLSPFLTILVILVGGELFGIAGMLVGIPLGGVGRVLFRDFKAAYLKSDLYKRSIQ